jgi:hypothetical protein
MWSIYFALGLIFFLFLATTKSKSLDNTHSPAREYGIFMGLNYYGPNLTASIYQRVAAAAKKVPVFVSVCADHNDTGGGAENRHHDPGDGGRIVPICDLGDPEAAAVRAGIDIIRNAGGHVLHYTHTRIANYPNGSEMKCCQCCEDVGYVTSRVQNITMNYGGLGDGLFVDNVVANDDWQPYYQQIVDTDKTKRKFTAMNENCAHPAHLNERCSAFCEDYGHSSVQCSNCKADRCRYMTKEFMDLADIHLLSEGTVGNLSSPDFVTKFPFKLTDADRHKLSMFTYNCSERTTPPCDWRAFIDLAQAKGFSKFLVHDQLTTSFDSLPPYFEEMVDYIAAMNVDSSLLEE